MKKIIAILVLGVSFMFATINLQTASKEELMAIKGIGEKKAEQIIEYRTKNKITKVEDLKNIKGFGDVIVNNVKKEVKVSDVKKSTSTKNKEDLQINKK